MLGIKKKNVRNISRSEDIITLIALHAAGQKCSQSYDKYLNINAGICITMNKYRVNMTEIHTNEYWEIKSGDTKEHV
jgi:hypothetical protein